MTRNATLLLIVLLALATSGPTFAQARPDFSGTWAFSAELTPPAQADRLVTHYTTLVITQTPTDMSVERRSFQQSLPPVVYRLDGAESADTGPNGSTAARAAWKGSTLVIAARRTFAGPQGDLSVDTVDTYSLDNGVMRIEHTETTMGGKLVANTLAYVKGEAALARAASSGRPEGSGGDTEYAAPDLIGERVALGLVASCPRDPIGFDRCVKERAKQFTPLRTPDGKPNLEGYWGSSSSLTGTAGFGTIIEARPRRPLAAGGNNSMVVDPPDGMIPYHPWAIAEREFRQRPENALMDPLVHCYNPGLPRQMPPLPFHVLRTNGYFVMLHEISHSYRIILMDGRPHLPAAFATWQGDSVGRWDGDTLVIETTNNNGLAYLDLEHNFLGPQVKVTERLMMVSPNLLYWTATVDDPTMFTRPWTMGVGMLRQTQKGFEILEMACHEENQDMIHMQRAIDKMKAEGKN